MTGSDKHHHKRGPKAISRWLRFAFLFGTLVLLAANAFVFWAMWRNAGVLGVVQLMVGEGLTGLAVVTIVAWDDYRRGR